MADNKMIAIVAVVVIAVVAVGAFFILNNGSNDDETYYYYIDFGDNDKKTAWYSASGSDADVALEKALKGTDITLTYSKGGYPNFDTGTWGMFVYNWAICSSTTATESVAMPNYDDYGSFVKSNGWDSFSGYGSAAKKVYQAGANVFFFSKYDETYAINDPTECKLWPTAGGDNPFKKGVTFDAKQDYYFYINFGDNDKKTGWYTAKAKNADDALEAALKDSGITVKYGKYGYPNFDEGTWGVFNYDWSTYTSEASNSSIGYPNYDDYGGFVKSNGWDNFSGYGDSEKKMFQSGSNVFYFAKYDSETYAIDDPTEDKLWQSKAENSPFTKA